MEARFGPRAHVWALVALAVALAVILTALAPQTFGTLGNVQSMMTQIAPLGLLALCIAITFLIGGIDLSVVNVANGAAIVAALTITSLSATMSAGVATLIGLAAAVGVGLVAGALNGLLIAVLRIHPIVATLGTGTAYIGIFTGITNGATVFGTGTMVGFATTTVAAVPLTFLLFLVVLVLLVVLTGHTRFGFSMYAVGESEKVTRFARHRVGTVQVLTYVVSGLIASVAGIVMFSNTNAANVSFSSSYLTQALLIAVVAGIDPYGGSGRLGLVLVGAIAMQELQTGINMVLGRWSGSSFFSNFAWGILLIAILGMSRWLGDRSNQRRMLAAARDLGASPPPDQQAPTSDRPAVA